MNTEQQKAEKKISELEKELATKNREVEIEKAFEKVREFAMTMRHSSDLQEVVNLVAQELNSMSLDITGVFMLINNDEIDKQFTFWGSTGVAETYMKRAAIPFLDRPIYRVLAEGTTNGERFFTEEYTREEKIEFFEHLFKYPPYNSSTPEWKEKVLSREGGYTRSVSVSHYTSIFVVNHFGRKLSDEDNEILKRFGKVFEQSYTRFLDIQKAEAHAREAEIQLALERVRARTMAMHKSEELAETAAILFQQMTELGVTPERLNICLIKEADKVLEVWSTDQFGTKISHHFNASLDEPTTGKPVYNAWKAKKKSVVIDLSGKELNDWIQYVREVMGMTIKTELVKDRRIHSVAFFSQGMILTTTHEPLPEESLKLLERFADVFNLTYRRFLDLQKAEARAFEAIKQASLDRVRGEIASMRTSEDLNRITPIIWRELKTLEIPFIRCGVFILDEEKEMVQAYLTTPDGKSLAVLNLSFDANDLTSDTVLFWKANKIYKKHWNKEEFISWTKSMIQIGQIQKAETYQGSSTPPESLDLHFVPFTQGMLYVGNVSPLTEEKLEVINTLAEAFSIAYARYEDFKNIEEAKSKIEITLNELKLAQAKLQELDQLKSQFFANISHEFRTPLTLILGQAESLMSSNIDAKGKGKLQIINRNARKLLELINQLLDLSKLEAGSMELRSEQSNLVSFLKSLFYSFESLSDFKKITLKFNSESENIPVVFDTDKMEKVFYNLMSNSLKFTNENGEIIVTVKLLNDSKVEIRFRDTGKGISKENISHIFDRFYQVEGSNIREFEGTGIGLSLAKQLIELHKGNIKVESEVNSWTEFTIELPLGNIDKQLKENPEQHLTDINAEVLTVTEINEENPEKENNQTKNSEIVLIVEDNLDVRSYIREQIENEYTILEAANGEEGIAKAQSEIPDLIITDVMMPKMDGYQFSLNIKKDEKTSHIPIIMLTAKAALDDKIEGLETGVDAYITKPFSAKELVVRVRNLINQRKQLREKFRQATVIKPSEVTNVSVDQKFLENVIDTIELNIGNENFALETLAEEVNMSVSQLNRKLNALIEQPPGHLIRSLRLQRSADLLKQNAGNVAEICYKVGFGDQANFSKAFKKQFGCSPLKYKKQFENNNHSTLS